MGTVLPRMIPGITDVRPQTAMKRRFKIVSFACTDTATAVPGFATPRRYSPQAAKASLKARSPGEPFSIVMIARRWLL